MGVTWESTDGGKSTGDGIGVGILNARKNYYKQLCRPLPHWPQKKKEEKIEVNYKLIFSYQACGLLKYRYIQGPGVIAVFSHIFFSSCTGGSFKPEKCQNL